MGNFLVILIVLCTARAATAQTLAREPLVTAALVSEEPHISAGEPFWVGLDLRMAPGWHINWINPGDAGLAPTVTWNLPAGFEASEIEWPYPERFELPELSIFGYEDRVLLLTRITPPRDFGDASEFSITARVDWLACREACIPGNQDLAITLPVRRGTGEAAGKNPAFDRAFAALPRQASSWRFEASLHGNQIVIDVVPPDRFEERLRRVLFYPIEQGIIANSTEQSLVTTARGYRLTVERDRMSLEKPERIQGVLVSDSGWWPHPGKAVEIDVTIQ